MSWVKKKSERFGRNMTYSRGFYSTACAKKLKKAAQTMQRNIAQHAHQSRQNVQCFLSPWCMFSCAQAIFIKNNDLIARPQTDTARSTSFK
jgi:hypothetical protein